MSDSTNSSIIHLEPVSQHLKARCVRAATRQGKKLVQWAIEMLTLCCEASEDAQEPTPPPACYEADAIGYRCTLPRGHSGEHVAVGSDKRVMARWPQNRIQERLESARVDILKSVDAALAPPPPKQNPARKETR